jgi:hypothetical protein
MVLQKVAVQSLLSIYYNIIRYGSRLDPSHAASVVQLYVAPASD